MSKSDTMAKLPGLYERSGVFQLRVVIPLALRDAYQGRTKIIESLKTTDRRTAAIEGAKRRAAVLQDFEDKRRELNPQPAARLSPDLGRIRGMFWSGSACDPQKATVDRMVSVPDDMSWEQKVAMGEASWAQGRAVPAPPVQQVTQQAQPAQPSRKAECDGLKASIDNLDSQARLLQSGQMQDLLKQQRQRLSDQPFRLGC